MGTITIQDVENSTIEVHGSGQYVSASLAVSVIEQQAETIELLKHGMKGDYDLDQWLDWAISKKHMMETIERLRVAINNLDSMEAPSDIKGRFQSELFWRGVYAARDALNKLEVGEL